MFLRASQLSLLTATAVFLSSCSDKSTPAYNPEVGPFDEDGNYIEAWADNPPKKKVSSTSWKKPTTTSWKKPSTITWGSNSWKTKKVVTPEPQAVVAPRPTVVSVPKPVVTPTPRPRPEPVVVRKPSPKPAPVVKPKPKPAPVKVTPKLRRHTVAKGETLYSLSRRYGVTVRDIQKANGISGTTIRDGQSLAIPAK